MKLSVKQQIDSVLGYTLITFNLLLAKFLGFILKRNHSANNPPNTIVFIKMLGLGSIFMALDAIQSIKDKYPSSKLILICGKGIKPGIIPLEIFDEVWEIKEDSFFNLVRSSIQTLYKCWKTKKLWVVDLEVYSKLSTVFSLWTLGLNRFGFYLNSVWFRLNLNSHNVFFNEFILVEENYKRLAFAMGCEEIVKFRTPAFFSKNKTSPRYIAVNNTCSELGKERIAPDQLIKDIMDDIINNTSYQIALLGAPNDKQDNDIFIQKYYTTENKDRIENIAGRFSFTEYYQFLNTQTLLLVTVDTGPLHFARRFGVSTLSLWGPTHPATRIQEDENNQYLYLAVSCSPCVHMVDVLPCKGDNFCMKNLDSKIAIQKINTLINKSHVAN